MNQQVEITIHGHLPSEWTEILDGLEVICQADGNCLITGSLPDQAALYGLLMWLRDLGLPLISINQIGTG